ncbi:unnamed protein product, partial [Rangifer tarandus platyrhynchus]
FPHPPPLSASLPAPFPTSQLSPFSFLLLGLLPCLPAPSSSPLPSSLPCTQPSSFLPAPTSSSPFGCLSLGRSSISFPGACQFKDPSQVISLQLSLCLPPLQKLRGRSLCFSQTASAVLPWDPSSPARLPKRWSPPTALAGP